MAAKRIVLDTNVLFSGLYSINGASYSVLKTIRNRKLNIVLSTPLVFEYEEILMRKRKELGFTVEEINRTLDSLCKLGEPIKIHFLWRPILTDPKDDHILELAMASSADFIVTHNIKDFEMAKKLKVKVKTPKQILEVIK